MKRVAGTRQDPAVVRIPEVVRIAPIAVEPKPRVITLHVEHIEVAVRIGNV